MGILYVLNCERRLTLSADRLDVDRAALASTKVYGIQTDLNLSDVQFAQVVTLLYVGYIPFQVPSNLFISKISRPGLCTFHLDISILMLDICCATVVWGAVSALTAACTSYGGLVAARICLGACEVGARCTRASR